MHESPTAWYLLRLVLDFPADTLTYSITSGNTDGVFSIRGKTGDIYVARDLDYETMTHVRYYFFNKQDLVSSYFEKENHWKEAINFVTVWKN